MEKLLIIDGNSILNRAYYGIRPLTAPNGTPTNAVYGFLNILFKYLEEEAPNYLCVAFDVKEKTFRHKRYELYKAQRKPAPDDFIVQLPVIKEILNTMNIMCIEQPGYEADDIIGTVSRLCDESNIACRILTGDKDDLQLISPNTVIKLVITRMGQTTTTDYDEKTFNEKYGVDPNAFIDIKALMGDASDNIPGVKGIGEKTAISLIQSYGGINKIYNDIDSIDVTPSIRSKLKDGRENAYLSRELAEICRYVPMAFDFNSARITGYDKSALAEIFIQLNFRSFIKKLNLESAAAQSSASETIVGVGKPVDFTTIISSSEQAESVSYIIDENTLYVKTKGASVSMSSAVTATQLKEFFKNKRIKKIGFNIKEDLINLSEYGIDSAGIDVHGILFDVMLAAYILDPTGSEYLLHELCLKYLNSVLVCDENEPDSDQISMLTSVNTEDKNRSSKRYCYLAAIERLAEKMAEIIEQNGQHILYYDVELPLTEVLADLQLRGMYIDASALENFGKMLVGRIDILRSEIYDLAGEEFNISSPKQLGVILFERLGLPFGKKNKSGAYSTNADIMDKLRGKHDIVEKVLDFRQLTKLQSTYITGLSAVVNPKTSRIHSRFNQMVTSTGRISSTEPNMQNIPVRTELGRELRRMFTAENPGWLLIDADYSQIELRVLAHLAGDESMISAFLKGDDIHAITASNVFGVPLDKVTSQMRSRAKAVNFGIVYGIGAFSLAQDIGTTRSEAQEYINGYLRHYSKVAEYMENVIKEAKENGLITTILGRLRYIPELKASSQVVRAFGERVARNAPIQGSAADIIKIAMVNVYRRLKAEGLKAKLILQVHDELIVEAPENEREIAAMILKEEMENAYALAVPLSVDMNFGKSWYDTK